EIPCGTPFCKGLQAYWSRVHNLCQRCGSASHVMLALCHISRQVGVATQQLDGTAMMSALLRKRPRVVDQAGHTLAQRVVAPLKVIGCARSRADRPVLHHGNHAFVHDVWSALPQNQPRLEMLGRKG